MFDYPEVPNSPPILVTVFADSRRGGFPKGTTCPYPRDRIESMPIGLGNVQG